MLLASFAHFLMLVVVAVINSVNPHETEFTQWLNDAKHWPNDTKQLLNDTKQWLNNTKQWLNDT
jgi:hypothetical protein